MSEQDPITEQSFVKQAMRWRDADAAQYGSVGESVFTLDREAAEDARDAYVLYEATLSLVLSKLGSVSTEVTSRIRLKLEDFETAAMRQGRRETSNQAKSRAKDAYDLYTAVTS